MDEASSAPVDDWDFSWFEGRATEERPSWGYQRLLADRLVGATAALDIQTGDGAVLAGALHRDVPPTMFATEGWPPNVAAAMTRLRPLGVMVVAVPAEASLPFADGAFDLVTSRHPSTVHWHEIARVLAPAGSYFAQHVGGGANIELAEWLLERPGTGAGRHHDLEAERAKEAGLEVRCCRNERLALEFFDVGAVVRFLQMVPWTVPGFDPERYHDRLRALHEHIARHGSFRSSTSRTLFEVRAPSGVGRPG